MYSYGPPHMAKQKQDDQLELTYSSYVRTQDVTLKTCQRRWMIGRSGERESGISMLVARHDDDDDFSPCKSLVSNRNIRSKITVYKLLLKRKTRNNIIVNKLLVLNRNTSYNITIYKLLTLRIVTWSYNYLQMIISYLKPYKCWQKNKTKGNVVLNQQNSTTN